MTLRNITGLVIVNHYYDFNNIAIFRDHADKKKLPIMKMEEHEFECVWNEDGKPTFMHLGAIAEMVDFNYYRGDFARSADDLFLPNNDRNGANTIYYLAKNTPTISSTLVDFDKDEIVKPRMTDSDGIDRQGDGPAAYIKTTLSEDGTKLIITIDNEFTDAE